MIGFPGDAGGIIEFPAPVEHDDEFRILDCTCSRFDTAVRHSGSSGRKAVYLKDMLIFPVMVCFLFGNGGIDDQKDGCDGYGQYNKKIEG